ncbi:hypothetical protein F2Q69_00013034 [Brassica cretica]|uniref:Uncharacterized protein n=1 Tax=Brassica cretica TaxID=69181 RepID=A0A8S9R0S7_BRACR|nr:hypothetical protein F2Q69_00013034 [Brassica cretica]
MVSWIGRSNSPLGELDVVPPSRLMVSLIGRSNSPLGELDWSIKLAIGRVGCGSSSPLGDLDVIHPRPMASWMWFVQLA